MLYIIFQKRYCTNIYFHIILSSFYFFNDTSTTEIYTLSLHDALPIFLWMNLRNCVSRPVHQNSLIRSPKSKSRSEEHTSELQSQFHLVCRLLLEKKNKSYVVIVIFYIRLVLVNHCRLILFDFVTISFL